MYIFDLITFRQMMIIKQINDKYALYDVFIHDVFFR